MYGFYFALLTAVIWGICPVLAKIGVRDVDPNDAVIVRTFAVVIIFLIYMIFVNKGEIFSSIKTMKYSTISILAIEGFLGALLGQFLYYRAQKYWEASKVVIVAGTFPVIAFILAIIILKEPLTVKKSIGLILVMSGVMLIRI